MGLNNADKRRIIARFKLCSVCGHELTIKENKNGRIDITCGKCGAASCLRIMKEHGRRNAVIKMSVAV